MTTLEALKAAEEWAARAADQVPETTAGQYGAACAQVSLAYSQLALAYVAEAQVTKSAA